MDWFRLARQFGCTVREAQARCDAREFELWRQFWRLFGPPAEDRLDVLLARATYRLAQAWLGRDVPEEWREVPDWSGRRRRVNRRRLPRPAELADKLRIAGAYFGWAYTPPPGQNGG